MVHSGEREHGEHIDRESAPKVGLSKGVLKKSEIIYRLTFSFNVDSIFLIYS